MTFVEGLCLDSLLDPGGRMPAKLFLKGGEKVRKFDKSDYLSVISFENGTFPRPIKVRNEDGKLDIAKILEIMADETKNIVADGDFRNIFYEIVTICMETEGYHSD